jgi:hypothetical protein
MRIVPVLPGAGADFECGNCIRDIALFGALRARGEAVAPVSLYLPPYRDGSNFGEGTPVFFGAINVYLQEKSALFRKTPAWIDRWFDSPRILGWAAKMADPTRSAGLEEMTLSMLRGGKGRQSKELERLIAFLKAGERPDVVHL